MICMDPELKEIFEQVSSQISLDEFDRRVEEKISLMAGLCDRRTAAMLVARELGASEVVTKISRIKPEMGMVVFTGKVLSISDIREFSRSDGSTGRVANLTLGDETGTIRVALWDDYTDVVKSGDLKTGICLKMKGMAKEGYKGTEVSLGRGGSIEEVDIDIKPRVEPYKISEIKRDMGDVNIIAMIIDPGEIREFTRSDGSIGFVRSLLLGDETGKIRLTLWNDHAKTAFANGEIIEIINGSSRERYGQVEIQTGNYTVLRKSDRKISYSEKVTSIEDLAPGMICSISGYVTGLGEIREFQREDGKAGKVVNIYISDATGRVRVALWGDHVDLIKGLDLGYKADLIDCQVKNGWNEGLEISCGWRTRITFAPPEKMN